MTKTKILSPVSLIFTTMLISAPAFCDQYWGLGIGSASYDIKPLFGAREVDDGPMLRGFIGKRKDNAAFEMDASVGSFDWIGSSDSHAVATLGVSGVGFIPLADTFEVYAKIGLSLYSTAVEYSGSVYEGETGVSLTAGAGVDINFTEKFGIRAEYQLMPGIDDGVDSGDIGLFTVNAVFQYK